MDRDTGGRRVSRASLRFVNKEQPRQKYIYTNFIESINFITSMAPSENFQSLAIYVILPFLFCSLAACAGNRLRTITSDQTV